MCIRIYIFCFKKKRKKKEHTHTHTHKQKAKETKEEKKISVENLTGYNDIVYKFAAGFCLVGGDWGDPPLLPHYPIN